MHACNHGCLVGTLGLRRRTGFQASRVTPERRLHAGAVAGQANSAPTHGGEAQQFAIGRDIQFDWWTLFKSPALDALVQQAFKANPTIDAAQAALKQAQEDVSAQQGYFFPTVSAGYTFQRQQLAGNMGGNSPGLQGTEPMLPAPRRRRPRTTSTPRS